MTLPAPLPAQPSDPILCYYANTTTTLQRAFLSGVTRQDFERVIFPQQRILFEANSDACLEVHTCSAAGETTVHQIPCAQLQVHQTDWVHAPSALFPLDPATQTDLAQE